MPWPTSVDYNEAIQSPATCFSDPELRAGEVACNALGLPAPCTGNFADVYQVTATGGGRVWAVKCFTKQIADLQGRYKAISDHLERAKQKGGLPFMVEFRYLEQGVRVRGQWYPALKMDWVKGDHLSACVSKYLDRPRILSALGKVWLRLSRDLRAAGMAHGDLQNGNVLLVPGEKANTVTPRLIDYDGMFVPSLAGSKANELGHPDFQHPRRREDPFHLGVDAFSHLVIYTAIRSLAAAGGGRSLWERYDNGEGLLFRKADFEDPASSALFQELWQLGDPFARALTGRLLLACHAPPRNVPLLDDLLEDDEVTRLAPADERRVDGLLHAGKPDVLPPPGPIPFMPEDSPPRPSSSSSSTWVPIPPAAPAGGRPATPARPNPRSTWQPIPAGGTSSSSGVTPNPATPADPNAGKNKCAGCGEPTPPEALVVCPKCGHVQWTFLWFAVFSTVGVLAWIVSISVANSSRLGVGWTIGLGIVAMIVVLVFGGLTIASFLEVKNAKKRPNSDGIHVLKGALGGLAGGLVFSSCCCGLPPVAILAGTSGDAEKKEKEIAKAKDSGKQKMKDGKPVPPDGGKQPVEETKVGKALFIQSVHTDGVYGVSNGPGGPLVATCGGDNTAKKWIVPTQQQTLTFRGHQSAVLAVALSTDNSLLVTGGQDSTVRIWDATTGQPRRILTGHTDAVRAVAINRAGTSIVSASDDETMRVWFATTGQHRFTLASHTNRVFAAAFSPDGLRIASGSLDKTMKIWDASNGKLLYNSIGHAGGVNCVAFSPDGRRIVTGSADSTLKVWDARNGREIFTISGHGSAVMCVAYNSDGKRLVSGSDDRTLRVWDASTGAELATLEGHTDGVLSASFSTDGRSAWGAADATVISGGKDGTLRFWELTTAAAAGKQGPGPKK